MRCGNTRRLALVMAAGAMIACTGAARAADLPTKPVRIVVPFPPGGTNDILARVMAEKVRSRFPGGVIVDNRPGAGGNIGSGDVFRSDPDGATLLISTPPPLVVNPFLFKMDFDTRKFTPITVLATAPNAIVVNPKKIPARNVRELIDLLKAHPDKYNFASQSTGSTSHLTGLLFEELSGTKMTHIPYKGTGPAMADLLGGQVDLFFDNVGSSAKYHQQGQLRILAVTDAERSPVLPDVPTARESGIPAMKNMVVTTWYAIVAPPDTPPELADELQKIFAEALAQPDTRRRLAEIGVDPQGWARDKTADFLVQERKRWGQIIEDNHVTME